MPRVQDMKWVLMFDFRYSFDASKETDKHQTPNMDAKILFFDSCLQAAFAVSLGIDAEAEGALWSRQGNSCLDRLEKSRPASVTTTLFSGRLACPKTFDS